MRLVTRSGILLLLPLALALAPVALAQESGDDPQGESPGAGEAPLYDPNEVDLPTEPEPGDPTTDPATPAPPAGAGPAEPPAEAGGAAGWATAAGFFLGVVVLALVALTLVAWSAYAGRSAR